MPGYTVEASVHCGQPWLLLSWGRQSRDPMTLHSLQHLLSRDSNWGDLCPVAPRASLLGIILNLIHSLQGLVLAGSFWDSFPYSRAEVNILL